MIKKGTTRMTFVFWIFAFKIPIVTRTLKHFVKGWLYNIDERNRWRKLKDDRLCPVWFSFFGLINLMPRAYPIINRDFKKCLPQLQRDFDTLPFEVDYCAGWDNFGILRYDKFNLKVLVDYGANRTSTEHCSDCDGDCLKALCKKEI